MLKISFNSTMNQIIKITLVELQVKTFIQAKGLNIYPKEAYLYHRLTLPSMESQCHEIPYRLMSRYNFYEVIIYTKLNFISYNRAFY